MQSLPKDVRDQIMSVSGLQGSKFWGKNFFDTAEAGVARASQGRQASTLNRYDVPRGGGRALEARSPASRSGRSG